MEKRFYFQHGLRSETSKKIKEESPDQLSQVMEIASNFEFAHFGGESGKQGQKGSNQGAGQISSKSDKSKGKVSKGKKEKSPDKEEWKKTATCHKCGMKGHISPDCKKNVGNKESNQYMSGSFYAILEVQTQAFRDKTKQKTVSIFIDNGCSLNGISADLAEALNLDIQDDLNDMMCSSESKPRNLQFLQATWP